MARVFAREDGFIGHESGRDFRLVKGQLYNDDDPEVLAAPQLFAPVAESTDAEVRNLKAQLAELSAVVAGMTPAADAKTAKKAAEPKAGDLKAEPK